MSSSKSRSNSNVEHDSNDIRPAKKNKKENSNKVPVNQLLVNEYINPDEIVKCESLSISGEGSKNSKNPDASNANDENESPDNMIEEF